MEERHDQTRGNKESSEADHMEIRRFGSADLRGRGTPHRGSVFIVIGVTLFVVFVAFALGLGLTEDDRSSWVPLAYGVGLIVVAACAARLAWAYEQRRDFIHRYKVAALDLAFAVEVRPLTSESRGRPHEDAVWQLEAVRQVLEYENVLRDCGAYEVAEQVAAARRRAETTRLSADKGST